MPTTQNTTNATGATQPDHKAQRPHYRTSDGTRRYFDDLGNAIAATFPSLIGKHIFQQLDALDMREEFNASESPHALPFSFSEYATHEFPPASPTPTLRRSPATSRVTRSPSTAPR